MIFMVINCMVLGILGIQSASEEVMKGVSGSISLRAAHSLTNVPEAILMIGKLRYSELHKKMPKATDKMLTQQLRELEGMV